MDNVKVTGKVLGYSIMNVYPKGTYEHYFYLDCDVIIKIRSKLIIDNVERFDVVESFGKLYNSTLNSDSIKVIKKYVSPQKKLGEFVK